VSDYRRLVGRRVLLFTESMTFDGVLVRAGKETLVLERVSAISPAGKPTPVDGEVVVPKRVVIWVQVP
jgi:hypothetical protein